MTSDNKPIRTTLSNGTVVYELNGVTHNDSGPAVIYPNGARWWYRNGEIHNENGPAGIWPNGIKFYYLNGEQVTDNLVILAIDPNAELSEC